MPSGPLDAQTTIEQLKEQVRTFSRERDWEQFHNPKDLALALVCEVGELLEHFRYRGDSQVAALLEEPATRQSVSHELADCLWLVLRLGDVCAVDLAKALADKLAEAARKYPVDQCRGRPDKYTAYRADCLPPWDLPDTQG